MSVEDIEKMLKGWLKDDGQNTIIRCFITKTQEHGLLH